MFYIFAAVAAIFGFLGLFRTIERVAAGDGFQPTQLLIGVIGILLAAVWLKRARVTRENS